MPDTASASVPQTTGHHVPPVHLEPALAAPAVMRFLPWITDGATDYLDTFIGATRQTEAISAIECGSGSSTGYLAQRVTRLVSFDHAADWHDAMKGAIRAIGLSNVEWRTEERPYWPHLQDYQDNTFHIALIDGRDRVACVEHVRRLVRPGGVLIVDNTERVSGIDGHGPYREMLQFLHGWQVIHFEQAWKDRAGWVPPHRWISSVWRKPSERAVEYTTLGLPL